MADSKEELNSVTSDSSFVILGNGPMSVAVESMENQNESFHKSLTDSSLQSLKSMELAMATLNSKSVNYEENPNDIQQKLDQLVKDNLLLKETLNQSNLTMKSQFSTLSLWYDEVMKTYELHKQKFVEGEEKISKLEIENANLKKMINESLVNCDRCSGNCSTMMVNIGDVDTVELKEKLESSEKKCKTVSNINEELNLRNKELEKMLSYLMKEKVTLEEKLEQALQESDELKKNFELRNDKCKKCQTPLDLANGNRESMQKESSESVTSAFCTFPSDDDKAENVKQLMLLNQQLTDMEKNLLDKSACMEKLVNKNKELVEEKEELQNTLKTCRKIVEQFREQVKNLNVQVKTNEETLESKTRELQLVKKEMQKLVLDCEEVAILRAQVELYQNDFNEERIAREKAVEAREKMAEELRLLKRMIENGEIKKVEETSSSGSSGNKVQKQQRCRICDKSSEEESRHDEYLSIFGFT